LLSLGLGFGLEANGDRLQAVFRLQAVLVLVLKGCGLAFVLEIILDSTRLDSLVGLYFAILSYLTALPEALLIAAQLIETMDLLPLFSVSGMDWSRFWLAWYLGLRLEVCGFGLVLQNGHVSLYHCE